ncbi:MAG: hypothetical protein AB7G37_14345 [Solirubrobacteraceae bacterium]
MSGKPNGSRPPETLQMSVAITDRGVSVSPGRVGAGPVRIVVTNQTSSSTPLALRRASGATVARTRVNVVPGTAATLQADLSPGRWTLSASRQRETVLRIGARRRSGDDALLLP